MNEKLMAVIALEAHRTATDILADAFNEHAGNQMLDARKKDMYAYSRAYRAAAHKMHQEVQALRERWEL